MAILRGVALLGSAAWFGAACFLGFWLAPSLFRRAAAHDPAVPDTNAAGDLLAPLFHGFELATVVAAGAALLATAALRARGHALLGSRWFLAEFAAAAALLLGSANVGFIGPRAAELRTKVKAVHGSYSAAPDVDPAKRSYQRLHGLSMIAFSGVALCAGLTTLALGFPRPRHHGHP